MKIKTKQFRIIINISMVILLPMLMGYMYMFLITRFVFLDVNEPVMFFYIDYLAVMFLFMTAGYFTIKLFNKGENNHG